MRCQPRYKPKISPELIKLAKGVTDKFENAKHCIWKTEWLNEFSQHQASRRVILLEIEKDFIESLYYELKDSSRKEIYLNPDEGAASGEHTAFCCKTCRPVGSFIIKINKIRTYLINMFEIE